MSFYALNLFDLADNDSYRQYSKRSVAAVQRHDGEVTALGALDGAWEGTPEAGEEVEPRGVMVLVEWPSKQAFQDFIDDPDNEDLHPLREDGTRNYLWWTYDKLEDLRPLFGGSGGERKG